MAEVVRQGVVRELEAKTVLSLDGWDTDCSSVSSSVPTIRLEFTTGSITCGGKTDPGYIGCSFIGPTTSTLPNTNGATIVVKVPTTAPTSWSASQITYVQDTTLHEILHGIGAGHEHARMDSTAAEQCRSAYNTTENDYNSSNSVYIGGYDANSVSNYCSARTGVLTATDVDGVNALYSGRWVGATNSVLTNAIPAGTIVGANTYVCRANNAGGGQANSHPGKLYKNGNTWTCYIGNGGTEQGYTTYEVLVGSSERRHFWRAMTSADALGNDVVLGGGIVDSGPAYVCRASNYGGGSWNLHAGKLIYNAGRWSCFIGNGGVEQRYESYDVLARDLSSRWISVANTVPANAIEGGTILGQPSYICQARVAGSTQVNTHIGKVYPVNGVWKCFIGNGGVEQAFDNYRVLIGNAAAQNWTATTSSVAQSNHIYGGNVEDTGNCYVCRVHHSGRGYDNTHVGKACKYGGLWSCFIGNGGIEQRYESYEIMQSTKPVIAMQ
jgi:hypothetical protein